MAPLAALRQALPDFGEEPRFPVPAMPRPAVDPAPLARNAVDALVVEAVSAAEERLRRTLQSEHEAALAAALAEAVAAERQAHAREIERLLGEQGAAAGAAIAAGLADLRAEVSARTSEACAPVLLPLLGQDLARRAVETLASALRDALSGRGACRVSVSGPRPLWEKLRLALEGEGIDLHFREASGFDLCATFDDRVLETRLTEWADAWKGAAA